MFVFWWMGRGYVTALIIFGSMMVFALILQALAPLIPDQQWYWGLSLIAAAAVNWKVGSHFNRRRLAKAPKRNVKERLVYKAPNRFLSVPMETFSIAILAAGVALTIYGIVHPDN
ncbi:hypothetical protein BH11PSE5_BH11PSE5_07900 [soil metagenome]